MEAEGNKLAVEGGENKRGLINWHHKARGRNCQTIATASGPRSIVHANPHLAQVVSHQQQGQPRARYLKVTLELRIDDNVAVLRNMPVKYVGITYT